MPEMSFDDWCRLSESDPAAFVAARRAAIDAHIDSAAPERRTELRLLQDEIDLMRARMPSANTMMRVISSMMIERASVLKVASERLREASDQLEPPDEASH